MRVQDLQAQWVGRTVPCVIESVEPHNNKIIGNLRAAVAARDSRALQASLPSNCIDFQPVHACRHTATVRHTALRERAPNNQIIGIGILRATVAARHSCPAGKPFCVWQLQQRCNGTHHLLKH